jgi:hypothetical protein
VQQPLKGLQSVLKWGYSAAARFNQYPGPILDKQQASAQLEEIEL